MTSTKDITGEEPPYAIWQFGDLLWKSEQEGPLVLSRGSLGVELVNEEGCVRWQYADVASCYKAGWRLWE